MLYEVITGARFSQMPAFGTDGLLTKAEIAAVANYVRSLSGLEADRNNFV